MKNIRKKLQNIFKKFFYKIFIIFYGKISGKIDSNSDDRVKIKISTKENKIKYKIFSVEKSRLYTNRIHDTALIINNSIVEGPSYQLRPLNNVDANQNIVFEKGTPNLKKRLDGRVLSLLTGGAGNDNYFHWLFDVLPRLSLCEDVFDISKIDFFLFPSLDKKFQKETIELLDIDKKKCLTSKTFRHIEAKEILVTEHPHRITNDASHDNQHIPAWISLWLKKKYLKNISKNSNAPKKIYIDRSDSTSNTRDLRKIINENEIRSFLKNNGFEIITLGKLHFREQINTFFNAEVIVGLHGAGFANLCFCNPDTRVIELKSSSAGLMYENLAKKNKLNYSSLSCEPYKFDRKNQFGHINVSIKLLNQTLNK